MIDQFDEFGELRVGGEALEIGHHRNPRRSGDPGRTDHPCDAEMVHEQHPRRPDHVVRRPIDSGPGRAVGMEEDRASLPRFVDDDHGMDRPGVVLAVEVIQADSFFPESPFDELRKLIAAQAACILATGAHACRRHQRRARQPASLTLPAADRHLAVGGRVVLHVEQIVDGRAAQPENIEGC